MGISERIDKITEIPADYRNIIIPAPKSVKIEMTSRCNFRCSYCAHRVDNHKEQDDMKFDFFKKVSKDMLDSGVEELGVFYIGESMLYHHIVEAVKYAKDIGYPYVFMTTNGSAASSGKLSGLMESGLDSLKFSLNHADEFQFMSVTGAAPNIFKKVIENVKLAHKIREMGGYKTKLYASSIRYDDKQHEDMKKLIEDIKPYVDEHYWLPLLSFGDVATEEERKMGYTPTIGNPGRFDCMRPPLPCWAVFREGHITHDGKLSACCFDASDSWLMADLNEVSFMEGWNSKEFQDLRAKHLAGDVHDTPCEGCINQNRRFKSAN